MNSGRFVLSQLHDLIRRQTWDRLVGCYNAEFRVRHFRCRQPFIAMVFAQLTWREGLRDIVDCINSRPSARYHLGFREALAKSTLADANEQRDWRLRQDLAKSLMKRAKPLYGGEDLGLEIDNSVYALDSTTVELSLTLFPWANFRKTKVGIKLHTQVDPRSPIPTCAFSSRARQRDVFWLDELIFDPGAFYAMDRGYMDFSRLDRIASSGAFFVTRAKDNLQFARQRSQPVDYPVGIRNDQIGKPKLTKARRDFLSLLRKIRYYDAQTDSTLVFLTNNLHIPALTVVTIYRLRWRIELFFRWIKGHLRIKHYYGTSPDAVKTQIWIAVCVYPMVAIVHKELNSPGNLPRTLQLLSVHPFEKAALHELRTDYNFQTKELLDSNQLML